MPYIINLVISSDNDESILGHKTMIEIIYWRIILSGSVAVTSAPSDPGPIASLIISDNPIGSR